MKTVNDPSGSPGIGTLGERSLHAALKQWYARPGDALEAKVDGYHVDIVRGDLLIEIQTRNVAALRPKLERLTAGRRVRLVHPIAEQKWIVRLAPDGLTPLGRRRSPRRGRLLDVFQELVSIPRLLARPGFSVEVLLIEEEEVRRVDATRRRRRKEWSAFDRRLIGVSARHELSGPASFAALLPATLPEPFCTADLAREAACTRHLARRIAYCLREAGCLAVDGKLGNAIVYRRTPQ